MRIYRVLAVLAAAVVLAASVNAARPGKLVWLPRQDDVYRQPTPEQIQSEISRDEVVAAIEIGTVLVDGRKAERFREGHIPGAINLPAEAPGDHLNRLFERAMPQDLVIVYCGGGECEESLSLFDMLKENGFVNLRLYSGGWRDWLAHDMPVEP